MAVFTDRLDQERQGQRVQRKGVTGKQERALRMMGYNKHGEKTRWGKVLGTINPVGDIVGRYAAQKMVGGKDSEVGRSMRESNKEYLAAKGAQIKFGAELAKTALTLGAGGGMPKIPGAGAPSVATPPISGDAVASVASGSPDLTSVITGGGDISSIGGEVTSAMTGSDAVLDMPTTSGAGGEAFPQMSPDMASEPYKGAMESNVGQEIMDMQEKSDVADAEDALKDDIEKSVDKQKKEVQKEETEAEKIQKNLDKVKKIADTAVPLVGSAIDVYQKNKAFGDKEDEIRKRKQSRKVMANYNLL